MRSRFLCVPLAVLCLLGKSASAQVTTYHDQTSFLNAVGATTMESFEGLAATDRTTNPITTASFTVTPDPGLIGILDDPATGSGAFATDGTHFLISYRPHEPAGTLHFTLTHPTKAFGFYLIDNGEIDGQVSLRTDTGEALSGLTVLQAPPLLPNGNVLFFGFQQTTPFSDVFLTSTGIDDSFGMDQIFVATTTPEPGSALLFGAGILLPGAFLLRRRTQI